eukprot:2642302-Prorocentrum_lima.AAC.1
MHIMELGIGEEAIMVQLALKGRLTHEGWCRDEATDNPPKKRSRKKRVSRLPMQWLPPRPVAR